MDDDVRDRLVTEMIERPQDREQILRDAELSEWDGAELASIVEVADTLWLSAQGAPALADDPVAAMLGLVPDSNCRLNSTALVRARKKARMSVSDVATRLTQRGWAFGTSDVFRWETRNAADVPPAVVEAISDILDSPVDDLITAPSTDPVSGALGDVRRHPLFEQLVGRWAQARRVSHAVAAATLESRMVATVHRGDHPDTEQLLRSLDALVTSVEQGD